MENREADERLLWDLGRVPQGSAAPVPSAEDLKAYREGRLPAVDVEALEAALADSADGRARLARLAEGVVMQPPAEMRERVLDAFDEADRPAASRRAAGRPAELASRRRRHWSAVAAAVLAVGCGALLLVRFQTPTLPADLAYEVEAVGAREIRGDSASTPFLAGSETRIEIDMSPLQGAVRDVEFGLYRQRQSSGLERVQPGPDLSLEARRGAARIRLRAGAVLDPAAEASTFFVVVARPGDLPSVLHRGADPVAALEQNGRRLVYPLEVMHLPLE